jgi:hypothetical protein
VSHNAYLGLPPSMYRRGTVRPLQMRYSWITLGRRPLSSALFLHYSPRVQGSGHLISHILKEARRLLGPSRSALHLITSSGTQRRVETRFTEENNLASTITQLRNNCLIALCTLICSEAS